MSKIPMTANEVLDCLPQKAPFRFIDEIVEIDDAHILSQYRFREDEYFYRGHFPSKAVTPGVILLEAMAQSGVVALGIYLSSLMLPKEEVRHWSTFFTDCQADFYHPVFPGALVTMKGVKVYWRRMKLKAKVALYLESGSLAAEATVSGLGVRNE